MSNCPVHNVAWKTVPAGTSKKPPYKPYNAFQACPVRGCDEKPPKGEAPAASAPVNNGQLDRIEAKLDSIITKLEI